MRQCPHGEQRLVRLGHELTLHGQTTSGKSAVAATVVAGWQDTASAGRPEGDPAAQPWPNCYAEFSGTTRSLPWRPACGPVAVRNTCQSPSPRVACVQPLRGNKRRQHPVTLALTLPDRIAIGFPEGISALSDLDGLTCVVIGIFPGEIALR